VAANGPFIHRFATTSRRPIGQGLAGVSAGMNALDTWRETERERGRAVGE
jgi:hypothetical protein